ncbi:PREDICTED: uncharacterized protein LOC105364997 [Ceratosolen solmsi marchali]|uniref:Uncharacterized protein LOC105364997 n=1 Tax=Ceratosolen solmsi marchali TaxID=326594 RepID=A0AAJ7DYR3_9HYME|nr:PREDICTED: uncharacterized protein LOC105364997 [Ceratosolen solmsi marchali]
MKRRLLNETAVIVGSINIRNGTRYYPIWAVDYFQWSTSRNKQFRDQMDDVIIMKLGMNVPDNIIIHSLASVPKENSYGLEIVAAGWGNTIHKVTPQILHTAKMQVISNEDCAIRLASLLGILVNLPEKFMCSIAEPYVLMHSGDSGCPIFFNEEIIAIHKTTIPFPDQPTVPSSKINVHSTIDYYRDFILDIINSERDW